MKSLIKKICITSDLKSLHQSIAMSFDCFMRDLPDPSINTALYNNNNSTNTLSNSGSLAAGNGTNSYNNSNYQSYESTILKVISGDDQHLWESSDHFLSKRIEEVRLANIDLKSKQGRLANSLIKAENSDPLNNNFSSSDLSVLILKIEAKTAKIENINEEILQLEADNESLQSLQPQSLPEQRPPPTAERNARESIKNINCDIKNILNDNDKMKRDFSIQIQNCSQGIEKSRKEVEMLELQLNSIQNRINLMSKAGNIQKKTPLERQGDFKEMEMRHAELERMDMSSKYPNYIRKKDELTSDMKDTSVLPKLNQNPNRRYQISSSNVCLVPLDSNKDQSARQIVSEPRVDLAKKKKPFNRANLSKLNLNDNFNKNCNININSDNNIKSNDDLNQDGSKNDSLFDNSLLSERSNPTVRPPSNRTPTPSREMPITDDCIDKTMKAINETDAFLAEINVNPEEILRDSQRNSSRKNETPSSDTGNNENNEINEISENKEKKKDSETKENNENNENNEDMSSLIKVAEPPKANSSKHRAPKKPPVPLPKKKDGDISFLPISEDEVKKVARPLTCDDKEKPRRVPATTKSGYEFIFFHIAERIPIKC